MDEGPLSRREKGGRPVRWEIGEEVLEVYVGENGVISNGALVEGCSWRENQS